MDHYSNHIETYELDNNRIFELLKCCQKTHNDHRRMLKGFNGGRTSLVLLELELEILASIPDEVSIETEIVFRDKFFEDRIYRIRDKHNASVGTLMSQWVYFDKDKRTITSSPFEPVNRIGTRYKFSKSNAVSVSEIAIVQFAPSDIDWNEHVTYLASTKHMLAYLATNETVSKLRLTFKKELHLTDDVRVYASSDSRQIQLCRDGVMCCQSWIEH